MAERMEAVALAERVLSRMAEALAVESGESVELSPLPRFVLAIGPRVGLVLTAAEAARIERAERCR